MAAPRRSCFLPLFERLRGPLARAVTVYGRVPLFFYVLHLFLIHALALLVGRLAGFEPQRFLASGCFCRRVGAGSRGGAGKRG